MKKQLLYGYKIWIIALLLCLMFQAGGGLTVGGYVQEGVMRTIHLEGVLQALRPNGIWRTIRSGGKQSEDLQPQIAEKILRFHVLANSDSAQDQKTKEAVRDAVGGYIEPLLSDAGTIEESRAIVQDHLDGIIETAERVLAAEGKTYGVSASVTRAYFPVKTYGNYTFPEGEYEALEIVLGEGAGHNWWCVLYPNMCFRGSVYEIVEDDADEVLREVLSPREYREVFDSGRFQIRFKFLEYFK